MNEVDKRIKIVNSIFSTPHGDLISLHSIHKECLKVDPLFYLKFAHYYNKNGDVRDHKKVFAAMALTSELYDFRDLGGYFLLDLDPKDFLTTVEACFGKFTLLKKVKTKNKKEVTVKEVVEKDIFIGGSGGKKRRIRKFTTSYLRKYEKDAITNSNSFLLHRHHLRKLYQLCHVKPIPIAAGSLGFKVDKNVSYCPVYNSFDIMKEISNTTDETKICELITKNKIPALSAIGAIKKMTPAIVAVLCSTMSGKQLQIFMTLMQKKGLLEDKDFKKEVVKKLDKQAKNLSLRGTSAAKVLGKDADIITDSVDKFMKSLPMIKKKVLLCIDKSGSMENAIDLGKRLGIALASKIEDPEKNLYMIAFNNYATYIPLPIQKTHSQFETVMKHTIADGGTSMGVGVKCALDNGFVPTDIVFISDNDENGSPYLDHVLEDKRELLCGVRVIGCLVGRIERNLPIKEERAKLNSIQVENLDLRKADDYSIPNVLRTFAKGGIRDLIQEIDSIDLFSVIKEYKYGFEKEGYVI